MLLSISLHHFAKSVSLGMDCVARGVASLTHMMPVKNVAVLSLANGINTNGVCAQLSPSIFLPAEVTGASVANAHMPQAANLVARRSSVIMPCSVNSIFSQNHCGRRMQAPHGAFFVANYSYTSNYFDGFYYDEGYIN